MADWTDLSSNFGYGTKLTSALVQALRDNITAAMEGASGSPDLGSGTVGSPQIIDGSISSLHLASSAIGDTQINNASINAALKITDSTITGAKISNNTITNGKIDTDNVTVSISLGVEGTVEDCVLTPCGNFGFYPTFSVSSLEPAAAATGLKAQMLNSSLDGISSSSMVYDDGNFSTGIYLYMSVAAGASNVRTFYAKQYYITASGNIKWIFIKRGKKTGQIISTYEAWDHPSNMNNPNIEHPFIYYNQYSHDILCINPSSGDLCDQEDLLDAGLTEVDILLQSNITVDSSLKFPEKAIFEPRFVNNKRRIKPIKNKIIKTKYIPEPIYTNIKLARIKFK